ncbi:DMT family transporter [Cyanobium sp. Aljojuca 7D2]|uniref:DMT family transporter n=1 Tax=Cyanobium sp. Aljojuca 7D2 TaxID=2823698 RepID=UPI0020CF5811|nr:DMT family transporter [Cyanobium sp. Aljojuca 7D2]MCP9890660.1 DMT family transporter [Cyanobium sp. Aljojuca 7D2]
MGDSVATTAGSHSDSIAKGSMLKGAMLLVAAFLANTLQSAFARAVGSAMDALMFTWLTFLLALILLVPVLMARGGRDLPTGTLHLHLLRAGTGMGGFLLFMTAAKLVNLVNANVLLNTTPLFIPLLAWLVLKQRIPRKLWIALAVGFSGMVIVVKPSASVLNQPGDLLGLAAGLICAVEFLTVKGLNRTESPLTQLWYFLTVGTAIASVAMVGHFHAISLAQGLLVLASATCLLSFQFLLIKAYSFADPSSIGAFQYSSVIFAGLIGWIWFQQIPTLSVVVGTLFICLGGVLSILRQAPPPQTLPLQPTTTTP